MFLYDVIYSLHMYNYILCIYICIFSLLPTLCNFSPQLYFLCLAHISPWSPKDPLCGPGVGGACSLL